MSGEGGSSSMRDLIGSRFYRCFRCRNVLAAHDDIVNKNFVAGGGRAFLFTNVMNVKEGEAKIRRLITGNHKVADVFCGDCDQILGWKYEKVYQEAHKYKEGRTVLIKSKISKLLDSTFY